MAMSADPFDIRESKYFVVTRILVEGWEVVLVTAAVEEREGIVQLLVVAGEEPCGFEKGQIISLPMESLARQCLEGISEVIAYDEFQKRFRDMPSSMVSQV